MISKGIQKTYIPPHVCECVTWCHERGSLVLAFHHYHAVADKLLSSCDAVIHFFHFFDSKKLRVIENRHKPRMLLGKWWFRYLFHLLSNLNYQKMIFNWLSWQLKIIYFLRNPLEILSIAVCYNCIFLFHFAFFSKIITFVMQAPH